MFKNIYEFSNAMTNNDPRNESCRPIQNERITFNSFEGGSDETALLLFSTFHRSEPHELDGHLAMLGFPFPHGF